MPRTITARLSRPIDAPELSRVWEGHVNLFEGPELVFSVDGRDVTIEYPPQPDGKGAEGLRRAFEQAIRNFYPDVRVEWLQPA